MSSSPKTKVEVSPRTTRRTFLQGTGAVLGASAWPGTLPIARGAHAAGSDTIKVALIGCGGRGTGAAADALSVKQGPVKLVAMADIFEDRLSGSFKNLNDRFAAQVDVPEDRKFVGFDAYKKGMDCLKPGDIAIFASPLTFRWVHFAR